MRCNVTECYWNMHNPKSKYYNTEDSKICVSEDLMEHYDETKDLTLEPGETCKGYLSYFEFCGCNKGETL